jgi:ATP-dependent helicase/nuclease subunit B
MAVILYKNRPPLSDIESDISRRLSENKSESFLYIVPTRRKVRELQREFLKSNSSAASPAFNTFTLGTFAAKLHQIYCREKLVLSPSMQAVLFNEVIKANKKKLKYFFPGHTNRPIPNGTIQKLISVINGLKEAGVYPSLLYEEINSADGDERQKLQDILLIYSEYESIVSEKFVDTGGIFKEVNEVLAGPAPQEIFRKHFPEVDSVFVAGFDEFSDPEITMLDYISKFNNLSFVISFDYFLHNDELFGHLRENFEKFISIGFKIVTTSFSDNDSFNSYITKNLFAHQVQAFSKKHFDGIGIIEANNREQEVEYIAKLIKQLVSENPDLDLSKICVSMYKPQTYTKLFHEIFPRYGIPANITDRYPLDQSPVVVSIISLLNVWQNNFRLWDVMRALSSPCFTIYNNGNIIDINNLHSVATSLKIGVDQKYWKKRIDERLRQIEIEKIEAEDPFEFNLLQAEIQNLHKAQNDILTLEKLLKPFASELNVHEFHTKLSDLLQKLKLTQNIIGGQPLTNDDNSKFTLDFIEKDSRAYKVFLQTLDELVSIFSLQNQTESKHSLKFYIEQLKSSISQTRYNIRQKYGYGVYVTSLEETRGLDFEIMFIAGAVDSEFPSVYQPEIFLSHSRQNKKEKYHLTENRYLFYQCIRNFSKKMYVSFPKRDGDLELITSSFVDSLRQIVQCDEVKLGSTSPYCDTIYSEEELLSRLGKNAGTDSKALADNFAVKILETVKHIYRSIDIEKARMLPDAKTEYKGIISEKLKPATKKTLDGVKQKTYSISQLEKYAACPFQYFMDQILHLNVVEELEEGITPIEKGSILHEVLFKFYIERRNKKLPPLFECSETGYNEAVEHLLTLTHEKLDTLPESDLFTFLEKELILGTDTSRGIIHEFLEYERNRKLDVQPSYFEVPIGKRIGGLQNTDNIFFSEEAVKVGNINIHGKVDRIDASEKEFTVIDYKSGSNLPSLEDVLNGISLQLPIYLYIIETIFQNKFKLNLTPAAGQYYRLKSKIEEKFVLANLEYDGIAFDKKRNRSGFVENDAELRKIIDKSIVFLNGYVVAIARGEFPLTPKERMDKVCINCDFEKICRKESHP